MASFSDYRGRRVLVTGHTGFKGSWLTLWLRKLGAEVAGYALPPSTTPSLHEALGPQEGVHSILADVRDASRLQAVIGSVAPDLVFHLAAQALVLPSYEDPPGTFATNIMGTANLLQACRGVPAVKAVVVITSDKCYRQPGNHPFKEEDPLGGADPYSASKACAEHIVESYRGAFLADGVGLATARAGNVIGGGDWSPQLLGLRLLESDLPKLGESELQVGGF